jgi:hypothetical protein
MLVFPLNVPSFRLLGFHGDGKRGKILFDSTAEHYLCAEDLAVLGEMIVRKLKARAARVSAGA